MEAGFASYGRSPPSHIRPGPTQSCIEYVATGLLACPDTNTPRQQVAAAPGAAIGSDGTAMSVVARRAGCVDDLEVWISAVELWIRGHSLTTGKRNEGDRKSGVLERKHRADRRGR